MSTLSRLLLVLVTAVLFSPEYAWTQSTQHQTKVQWEAMTDLPNSLGVAGPFTGTHKDSLIVAGGANFPNPIWETEKQWLDEIYVLPLSKKGKWISAGRLPRKIAYGCSVSTNDGILCIGGNNSSRTFSDVFLLAWSPTQKKVSITPYPSLPGPCAFGSATKVGSKIYVAGGQRNNDLSSAMNNFWVLDLSKKGSAEFGWNTLSAWPGKKRAFNLTIAQHDGYDDCIYVISGRRKIEQPASRSKEKQVEFLKDVWSFNTRTEAWTKKKDAPYCVMAGTGVGIGQSHIFIPSGADGSLFHQGGQLKDNHPGFSKRSFLYHTITDTWTQTNPPPTNQVTTTALKWQDQILLASGEIRPRVRSAKVWRISLKPQQSEFGLLNYSVLVLYLLAMVGVGLFFAKRNKTTNDFFRGGKRIPWWAAGCSIFATMLSSLTFTGIPAKSYAQDWVYSIGNFTIPLVAFVAVYVALPFYRKIDVTSAYEYLENRFHRSVRQFGSLFFLLFHLFRMAIVMSLTGLALSAATPLTPTQAVLLMGVLSIIYCSFGGIEAVIWTDTIQTVVLLGGGILAIVFLILGTDGNFDGFLSSAGSADKLRLINWHSDPFSTQIAFWVILVGAIAQNTSSYTADQAVVQRYMTTKDPGLAAKSIWTNALLTIPATLLFFGLGTALFTFYQSNPHKLDPTIATDQIFPLFIANELPAPLAGLIVAAVFAAAQSTVSTSMNSTATTLVTDFIKPVLKDKSDRFFLRLAQACTIMLGILGTVLAILFVDPSIKSLFDAFIKVIGLFMGVLGGLFL